MLLKKHLNSFNVYIVILFLSSAFAISGEQGLPIINFIFYLFIHILLIYLCIYHFKIILYFIFFLIGIIFDIFIINEIGLHVLTFMLLILFLNLLKKIIISLSSIKIYVFIYIVICFSLIFEMVISAFMFNFNFNFYNLIKGMFIYLIISYPSFYIFSKVDKLD